MVRALRGIQMFGLKALVVILHPFGNKKMGFLGQAAVGITYTLVIGVGVMYAYNKDFDLPSFKYMYNNYKQQKAETEWRDNCADLGEHCARRDEAAALPYRDEIAALRKSGIIVSTPAPKPKPGDYRRLQLAEKFPRRYEMHYSDDPALKGFRQGQVRSGKGAMGRIPLTAEESALIEAKAEYHLYAWNKVADYVAESREKAGKILDLEINGESERRIAQEHGWGVYKEDMDKLRKAILAARGAAS